LQTTTIRKHSSSFAKLTPVNRTGLRFVLSIRTSRILSALTVPSQRASLVRFHMQTTDQKYVQFLKQGNIKTFVYTNDKDQTFTYDLASGKEITTEAAAQK
jgi:hypothetical protein